MGVLDTTYTFTATDIVTSAKLNNVIDQTTFTSSAFSGTTLAINGSGQLRVNASGITSLELADNSVITAKIADSNVTTAKILDANVTQAKLASNTVGNGPAFRAYATTDTSIGNQVHTQVNLVTELFDTNSNFANSRFTPTVAGYYLISGQIFTTVANTGLLASIAKNNVQYALGTQISASSLRSTVSDIVYLNGTGDYVALNAYSGGAVTIQTGGGIDTYFSGCLIRSA
jgi:hypothetical protein